ncbi:uncharacterized protein FOMMEDRAFT_121761 [Fomitiporia mediterranea MF3/22]|uniref:uncharacterized protein n=1 Tax=Fomitiporia mediterranea (strain MF3/22) TaxID=694068 RepID=UPI0004409762|nr:uncharacterized protein FOMMEDRAFT_121761 [Fomitiporia mediterranea MF3/22]EJD04192.1 hypothetical protein FOMMEDRAFT_121761 [Fomitiporia mediterranea MF3/22]
MIAEILLVLAGHSSSLFPTGDKLHQDFVPYLHPGEQHCLVALGHIALSYRNIKAACARLSQSPSRYICAFCAKLNEILRDEYEALVVETEAKILQKDASYVGRGSFVPLSAIRATFAEWETPFIAVESLVSQLEKEGPWPAGKLIDLLLVRSETGSHRVSYIMSRLAEAVQKIWRTQLSAFLVHGSLSTVEPLANETYALHDEAFPSRVSPSARESIVYVGRAIGTVKAMKWHRQIPSTVALSHARLINSVLPQDQHAFEEVISQIRANVSEWLWSNVLTMPDVEDALESLANYFLMQNGEFGLSLIREFDRLKNSRLTARSGPGTLIREQDLHLALLRASLGTSAQHDPSLSRIRFQLPNGPVRPLLPALSQSTVPTLSSSQLGVEQVRFDDVLLGFPLRMTYGISWPLDLFLQTSDLTIYAELFAFLSSLRHVHTRVHSCWATLSNSQRARRRWTGLDEGGTADSEARKELLRCGWGVVRLMGWFLDVLLGYLMNDVVETEFQRLKGLLKSSGNLVGSKSSDTMRQSKSTASQALSASASKDNVASSSKNLDFTTLRNLHTTYLDRLLSASLLTQPALAATIRSIFDVCERFVGLVERWGDVLPGLLTEGSISEGVSGSVGRLVKERQEVVKEIDQNIKALLETFYEQLSSTTSQPLNITDASKSIFMNATVANFSNSLRTSVRGRTKGMEGDGETRRRIERLLLRLDFNRLFSKPGIGEMAVPRESLDILKEGGLA